jgi:hypothetical protein
VVSAAPGGPLHGNIDTSQLIMTWPSFIEDRIQNRVQFLPRCNQLLTGQALGCRAAAGIRDGKMC